MVIDAKRGASPFSTIVQATEDDVDLVVIDGHAALRHSGPHVVTATHCHRADDCRRPYDAAVADPAERSTRAWDWSEVVDRMEEVRAHPKREVEAAHCDVRAVGRADLTIAMPRYGWRWTCRPAWHRSAACPRISTSWSFRRCSP